MALFENFPYTNFHELNLDWIIEVVKNFLEQYSHIEETITDGETALTNKEQELEQTFETAAEAIVQAVIASIPPDYTALSNKVDTKLGFVAGTDLTDTDLNGLKQIGIFETTNSNIGTISNLPPFVGSPMSGIIVVYKYNAKYVQLYITSVGEQYYRYCSSAGTWTDWIKNADSTNTPVNSVALDSNVNLDTITTMGIYRISADVATHAVNIPFKIESCLIVVNRNNRIIQTWYAKNGEVYNRFCENNVWSVWQSLSAFQSTRYIDGNTDFDTLTQAGIFRITTANAGSAVNIPVTTSGILTVFNAEDAIVQTFYTLNNYIATRYRTSGGIWTKWRTEIGHKNAGAWLSTNKVMYRAHQGDKANAPANSVPAYELACSGNTYDIIQIAVPRQSADGTWYVMHDDDVSITTNGTGNLSELHDSYINSLYIDTGVNVDQYTHAELHVPTLAEILQIARKYGKQVSIRYGSLPTNIDTAENLAKWESFFNIINKYGMKDFLFSANAITTLKTCRLFSDCPLEYYLIDTTFDSVEQNIVNNNLDNIVIFKSFQEITDTEVKKIHSHGYKVAVWHDTSNTTTQANEHVCGWDIIQNANI